jgi:hypothetical protein
VGRNGEEGQGNRGDRNAVPEHAGESRGGSGMAVSFPEKKRKQLGKRHMTGGPGMAVREKGEAAGWTSWAGSAAVALGRPSWIVPFLFFSSSFIFLFFCFSPLSFEIVQLI